VPGAALHRLHALARLDDLIVRAGVRLAACRMELEGRAGKGTGAARLRGLAVRLERRLENLEEARRGVVLARMGRHARAVWLDERGASSER
jgi:hypothetical protein